MPMASIDRPAMAIFLSLRRYPPRASDLHLHHLVNNLFLFRTMETVILSQVLSRPRRLYLPLEKHHVLKQPSRKQEQVRRLQRLTGKKLALFHRPPHLFDRSRQHSRRYSRKRHRITDILRMACQVSARRL